MPTLDGNNVVLGDQVFDVVWGPGTVREVLPTNLRVQFTGKPTLVSYGYTGVQPRWVRRTLYWRNPIIVVPLKNEAQWNKIKPIIDAVYAAFAPRTAGINQEVNI